MDEKTKDILEEFKLALETQITNYGLDRYTDMTPHQLATRLMQQINIIKIVNEPGFKIDKD